MKRLIVQLMVIGGVLAAAVGAGAQYYGTPTAVKAETKPATSATNTTATLNATVNAGGGDATFSFDIGLAAGNYTSSSAQANISGGSEQNVSATLTGLTPGTTYHFRVKVTKQGVTTFGEDMAFTTTGSPPTTPPTTVPVPVPVERTSPRSVTDSVTPKSDSKPPYTYTVSGSIVPPASTRQAGSTPNPCSGRVSIQTKKGKRTISNRRTTVRSNCRWKLRLKFRANRKVLGRRGTLRIRPRFLGNAVLKPRSAKTITVRYGKKRG